MVIVCVALQKTVRDMTVNADTSTQAMDFAMQGDEASSPEMSVVVSTRLVPLSTSLREQADQVSPLNHDVNIIVVEGKLTIQTEKNCHC